MWGCIHASVLYMRQKSPFLCPFMILYQLRFYIRFFYPDLFIEEIEDDRRKENSSSLFFFKICCSMKRRVRCHTKTSLLEDRLQICGQSSSHPGRDMLEPNCCTDWICGTESNMKVLFHAFNDQLHGKTTWSRVFFSLKSHLTLGTQHRL